MEFIPEEENFFASLCVQPACGRIRKVCFRETFLSAPHVAVLESVEASSVTSITVGSDLCFSSSNARIVLGGVGLSLQEHNENGWFSYPRHCFGS